METKSYLRLIMNLLTNKSDFIIYQLQFVIKFLKENRSFHSFTLLTQFNHKQEIYWWFERIPCFICKRQELYSLERKLMFLFDFVKIYIFLNIKLANIQKATCESHFFHNNFFVRQLCYLSVLLLFFTSDILWSVIYFFKKLLVLI